jgi:hypothetical protein
MNAVLGIEACGAKISREEGTEVGWLGWYEGGVIGIGSAQPAGGRCGHPPAGEETEVGRMSW